MKTGLEMSTYLDVVYVDDLIFSLLFLPTLRRI